jgi:hypothetical protein
MTAVVSDAQLCRNLAQVTFAGKVDPDGDMTWLARA